jgi:hypothetical protein
MATGGGRRNGRRHANIGHKIIHEHEELAEKLAFCIYWVLFPLEAFSKYKKAC